ncbi:MAG TPA: GatB/YqeY domain-containing protein [Polyangiaceae bacterium]|jgi:uncharacterized protein YqeY|nr:GatB/YqeY domain-containing protein [Polyangiaceae bacterium]
MLSEEIKARMFKAMKAGNVLEKEILRVAMGEITTDAARPGKTGSDEEVQAILRKLIKSNEESLGQTADDAQKDVLRQEIAVLASFLPKSLGVDEIVSALGPVESAIKAAGNDGQATGVAMKHLKASGAVVSGKDVTEAVKRIRS